MCLNVFTVYVFLSAYVMHVIDMLFNKRPLTYLLTYLKIRFENDILQAVLVLSRFRGLNPLPGDIDYSPTEN